MGKTVLGRRRYKNEGLQAVSTLILYTKYKICGSLKKGQCGWANTFK